MEPKQQFSVWYFLIAFLLILALQEFVFAPTHLNNLPYSDFKALLKAGKISNVGIGETIITGTLNNEGVEGILSGETAERVRKLGRGEHRFTTVRVEDSALVPELEAAKVPAGPLYTPQQALDDAHIRQAKLLVDTPYPGIPRPAPLAPTPVDLSETPGTFRHRAPTLGEHTDPILGELGYAPADIAALRAQKVV